MHIGMIDYNIVKLFPLSLLCQVWILTLVTTMATLAIFGQRVSTPESRLPVNRAPEPFDSFR